MLISDIVKYFKKSHSERMSFTRALEELGIDRYSKTDEGLSIIQLCTAEGYYIPYYIRAYILLGCLSIDNKLGHEEPSEHEQLVKIVFNPRMLQCIRAFIAADDFNVNMTIDGKLFIEFALSQRAVSLFTYEKAVEATIGTGKVDINALNSHGDNTAKVLVKRHASRLLVNLLVQSAPAPTAHLRNCEIAEGIKLIDILKEDNFKSINPDEFRLLLHLTPSKNLDLTSHGTKSISSQVIKVPSLLENIIKTLKTSVFYDDLILIINKLLPSQSNQDIFIAGLLVFLTNQYEKTTEPVYKDLFRSIVMTIGLDKIYSAIKYIPDDIYITLRPLVICMSNGEIDLAPLYSVTRTALINDEIQQATEEFKPTEKQLSLLLGLKGRSNRLTNGSFEGGINNQDALYVSKLLSVARSTSTQLSDELCENIRQQLNTGSYYSRTLRKPISPEFKEALKEKLIYDAKTSGHLLVTGWKGHTITLWIKDEFLYRCNGGGASFDSTIEVYKIGNIEALTGDLLDRIYANGATKENRAFIQRELHFILDLKLVCQNTWKFQRAGNCSLHSILLGIQAIIASSYSEAQGTQVNSNSLRFSAFIIDNLQQELRYQGLVIGADSFSLTTELLFSRFITQAKTARDRMIVRDILSFGVIEISERTLISQIYQYLLDKYLFERSTNDFVRFMKSIGIAPFTSCKQYGENAITLMKLLHEIETRQEEILDFNRKIHEFTLLHFAVITDNIELARYILSIQPRIINTEDINGIAPIGYSKSVDMLRLLLSKGAKTEWGNRDKNSVICCIIERASYKMVAELITHNAEVSLQAINKAPYNKDERVLELLLNNFDDDIPDNKAGALHFSAKRGSLKHLKMVLSRKRMRRYQLDINGVSPLTTAILSGRHEALMFLAGHPQITPVMPHRGDTISSFKGKRGMTAGLCLVIEHLRKNKEENLNYFAKTFMNKSSLSSLKESAKDNPLLWFIAAIKCDDLKAFKGAMLYFPDLDISDFDKFFSSTALHAAIDARISILFLEQVLTLPGVKLDCRNGAGETLAQIAAIKDNPEVLSLLHRLGAPMNEPDSIGITPLMDAADRGCLKAVKLLTSIPELDSNYIGYKGKTALEMAISSFSSSKHEIITLISEHQKYSLEKEEPPQRCMIPFK